MKKIILLICLTIFVLGCSNTNEQPKIEEMIKTKLKDPDSATFKDFAISNDNVACIAYNAKNSYGGYGDWSYAKFIKNGSSWTILEMEFSQEYCSQQYFDARDEYIEISEGIVNHKNTPDNIREITLKSLEGERNGGRRISATIYKSSAELAEKLKKAL